MINRSNTSFFFFFFLVSDLFYTLFRLCLMGGKEVREATMSSIKILAKTFSSYKEEVLVREQTPYACPVVMLLLGSKELWLVCYQQNKSVSPSIFTYFIPGKEGRAASPCTRCNCWAENKCRYSEV